MMFALPGIGTNQVPAKSRAALAIVLAIAITFGGVRADAPPTMIDGALMIALEAFFGFILGFIPQMVIGGLSVAGQVVTGVIGLGQANMIDPSLGGTFAILARLHSLFGTIIFLMMDGHHEVIRAMAALSPSELYEHFRLDFELFEILMYQFSETFRMGIIISGPILITVLIAQFILGLLTRLVPQFNIFIISLPLTILIGFYMTAFMFPAFTNLVLSFFLEVDELLKAIQAV